MTTFQVGLNNPNSVFSLGKTPPASMMDLLFKVQKYMNGENALTAKGLMGKWKKEESTDLQSKKRDRKDNSSDTKASKSSLEELKKKISFYSFTNACRQNSDADKRWSRFEMAETIKFVLKMKSSKEIFSLPQRSWPLHW